MDYYMTSIKKAEVEVSSKIISRHAKELQVFDMGLNEILRGFEEFRSLKGKADNRLEGARLFLCARSFKSLRMAMTSLVMGYYQQAFALVRMAAEDQLVAEDMESHSPTLAALEDEESRLGRGCLSYRSMAYRISEQAGKAWDDDYGSLSTFGAHPRSRSLISLLTIDPDAQETTLRVDNNYDEVWVNAVLVKLWGLYTYFRG